MEAPDGCCPTCVPEKSGISSIAELNDNGLISFASMLNIADDISRPLLLSEIK